MTHINDTQLNEYIDDELAPAVRADVDAHCTACADCARALERLGTLRLRLAEMPRAIEPPGALRDLLRARLDDENVVAFPARRTVTPRRWLAAAAVVLVAASSATTVMIMRSMRADRPAFTTAATRSEGAQLTAVSEIEGRYITAIEELERTLVAERASLSPETIRLVETNLDIIDRAVAEARAALLSDPSSPILADMLRAGYERKLDVLRSARAQTVQM